MEDSSKAIVIIFRFTFAFSAKHAPCLNLYLKQYIKTKRRINKKKNQQKEELAKRKISKKKNQQKEFTSRLRLELRSKAPQASRISTTLSGHKRATLISTFKDINFILQEKT